MVGDGLSTLIRLARTDEGLRARLESAENADAVIAIAAELGITVTADDLRPNPGELSEQELGNVAGGDFTYAETPRGCSSTCWVTQSTCVDIKGCW